MAWFILLSTFWFWFEGYDGRWLEWIFKWEFRSFWVFNKYDEGGWFRIPFPSCLIMFWFWTPSWIILGGDGTYTLLPLYILESILLGLILDGSADMFDVDWLGNGILFNWWYLGFLFGVTQAPI